MIIFNLQNLFLSHRGLFKTTCDLQPKYGCLVVVGVVVVEVEEGVAREVWLDVL